MENENTRPESELIAELRADYERKIAEIEARHRAEIEDKNKTILMLVNKRRDDDIPDDIAARLVEKYKKLRR